MTVIRATTTVKTTSIVSIVTFIVMTLLSVCSKASVMVLCIMKTWKLDIRRYDEESGDTDDGNGSQDECMHDE